MLFFLCGAAEAATIQTIRVDGNERIERETVLSFLELAPGQSYDQERADQSLKNIYASGMFATATIALEGSMVVVHVQENPMVSKVAFEGNKKIKNDVLSKETMLKPRMVMTKARVRQDANRIAALYHKMGRYSVSVTPKMITLPENRVNIVYEIVEGNKTPIRSIVFVGNKRYSDTKLRDVIRSHEDRWYRFFSSNSTYDPDRLEFDKALLTKFYQSQGYADFTVHASQALLTPDRKGFIVTITVDEGMQYRISEVRIESHLKDVQSDDLQSSLQIQAHDLYDIGKIEKTIDHMTDALGDKGYAFVNVEPVSEKNLEQNEIQLTFLVERAPKVYVNRINIAGNTRTYDAVIRREMQIAEGDPFNISKIRRSKEKIEELDYFKQIEMQTEPQAEHDRINLNVKVKEKSTGSLNAAIGASSTEGALIKLGFNETNFMGRGQELGLNASRSKYNFETALSFTQPYFMGTPIAAGFDMSHAESRSRVGQQYRMRNDGLVLRGSYPLTDRLQHTASYNIETMHIASNLRESLKPFIQEMLGHRVKSSVGNKLFYNHLDSLTNPTEGYYATVSQEVAGVGGDVKYLRHTGKIGAYWPVIPEKVTAKFSVGAGYIQGLSGQRVLLFERFQLGGEQELRGFEFNGVGPRERIAGVFPGDPLGGKMRYLMRAEIDFPIGLPEEYGLKWFPFVDAGAVLKPELSPGMTSGDIFHDSMMRVSAGVGIGWASPLGHVTITYAKPIQRRYYDDTQRLQFGFGKSL